MFIYYITLALILYERKTMMTKINKKFKKKKKKKNFKLLNISELKTIDNDGCFIY